MTGGTSSRNCLSLPVMDEILTVLALCTPTQRERFLLYALHDFSYAEIGRLCGWSFWGSERREAGSGSGAGVDGPDIEKRPDGARPFGCWGQ